MRSSPFVAAALLALAACAPTEEPPPVEEEPAPPTWCERMGWTERPFITDAAYGPLRRDVADDFLLQTTEGDYWWQEQFTGCETYLFVPDSLRVSPLDATRLIEKQDDLVELIGKSPPNVQYFFLAESGDAAQMDAFAAGMTERIAYAMENIDDPDWWAPRLHVVTEPVSEIGGWVDDAMEQGGPGFGIDRFQRVRGIGQLADVRRYRAALANIDAWPWEANLAYVAHEAQYYNYESDREDELDAVDWTEVHVFYDENMARTGRNTATVTLPDAATMAGFDTLWVDLRHLCDPTRREFGNCDAWDANNELYLCSVEEPERCDELVSRWITTYHREGRWLVDATEALPRLREGGVRRFRYGGARGGHFISARLLLANTGKGAAPFALEPLWTGGNWGETYNDEHGPMEIDVPADATRVHLSVTVTGHGMSEAHNCAEFCDHHHVFTVGGVEFVAEHPNMGDQEGCLEQIDQGAVPNQHGTWWFERSSWCPGKQVDPWIFDITDQVTPGETATITYTTNWGDPAFGGAINLQTWVTYWR